MSDWGTGPYWPSVGDAFERVAELVGGTYKANAAYDLHVVQRQQDDWIVTLQRIRGEAGFHTWVLAPFHNPDRFRLEVRNEGVMDDLWKKLGFLQDVEVGDTAFDRRYLVKGQPASRVRDVLDDRVRELIMTQPQVRLSLGRSLLYGTRLPPGVDVLSFKNRGEIRDVDRLASLFELFSELLPRLRAEAPGWEEDPEALIRRLTAPGGRAEQSYWALTLWRGDAPRRDAAERLGRLGDPRAVEPLIDVLRNDEDDELVARAVDALGRLGDERAVPELFLLLGARTRSVGEASVADHAADALRSLGHHDVVHAFDRALKGDPDALPAAAGPYRDEIVRALMDVVESAEFGPRAAAALALGALGANEALPLLREKSYAWGMRTSLTEAAQKAVDAIEAKASLPRPADRAPAGPDTHPRPAGRPGPDPGTLPRPAEEDGAK